ncbi:hypothetical protein G6F65_019849 [Rhizopus arrhizus]|nr:hypothetical protein G6F65_019849 [Rhizopus arrhizus]
MTSTPDARPPLPPFTPQRAMQKVRLAEDGWNSRDPDKVALAYSLDTHWRNRAEFVKNRDEARAFLARKWAKELDYRLIKELWAYTDNRIAVRYAYEWHDDSGNWFRSYGNENWEFGEDGLMVNRYACINDLPIKEADRKFRWPLGRRPDDHLGLSELGLPSTICRAGGSTAPARRRLAATTLPPGCADAPPRLRRSASAPVASTSPRSPARRPGWACAPPDRPSPAGRCGW